MAGKPTQYRDIITSHLREDTRILASVLSMRRIHSSPTADVYICIYSGMMGSKSHGQDLVTCLVVFKAAAIRVMFKLWTAEIRGNRDEYIEQAVSKIEKNGRSPADLIQDAKSWSRLPAEAYSQ